MSTNLVIRPESLGSEAFRAAHGVRSAYVAGSMVKAIASEELVIRMARAGMLSYFGSGGLPLSRVDEGIRRLVEALGPDAPFGVNLLCNTMRPEKEDETVQLFL
ncbi:MAG TPA: 2-nitropropane dioxygenase, partial [Polyangiaceae bacterium]|nr:2-nitropropane dioxygenase [Polyangiaceae bacterium]